MATYAHPEQPASPDGTHNAFARELEALHAAILKAEEILDAVPEQRATDSPDSLKLEIAQLAHQLFLTEHDSAGAFKSEKFGRRIQGLFEPGADKLPELALGADGQLKLEESENQEAKRRILLVNMTELARFNKEGGGHAAGDAALKATVKAIEGSVIKVLEGKEGKAAEYQIYRLDGNTFGVELSSISLQDFSTLVNEVQAARPSVDRVEPAPLVVRGFDFRDVISLVNGLQERLSGEETRHAQLTTKEEAAREIFTMLRRMADWDMEMSKFSKLAERVREKINAAAQEKDDEVRQRLEQAAQSFFENYAQKAFQNTDLATYDSFKAIADTEGFHTTVDHLSIRHAEKRFAESREIEWQLEEIIDQRVKERGIPPKISVEDAVHASSDVQMEGLGVLQDAKIRAETAERAAEEDPKNELAALRAKRARLKYQIEAARRDAGTGLLSRGVHYEHLEQALKTGKDVAVVFIDMAFLKYFDQMGGTGVGDAALKTAASLIEQAIKEARVSGQVYRYGGDEFTIQVEGGKAAADKVIAVLERLRAASAPIPRTAKSLAQYAPTQLSFNYGQADRAMLEELWNVAKDDPRFSKNEEKRPDDLANAQAELITKAADVGIEFNKAYSRFLLLIGKLREPEYGDPARKIQTDALVGFSNKAIFFEWGGVEFLRQTAEGKLTDEALEKAVLTFVLETVGKIRQNETHQAKAEDQLVGLQAEVSFLNARLEELSAKVGVQDEQIVILKKRLTVIEREKAGLMSARKTIDRLDLAA